MKRVIPALFVVMMLIPSLSVSAQRIAENFPDEFAGFDGTLIVYDESADTFYIHNEERSKQRYTPCSTYKIPNSLIALETGVVTDADRVYTWDSDKYPTQPWWPASWRKENTLRTAIKNSVVPFYRQLASRIGESRMKHYITKIDYGNNDISSGIDAFWLSGSLKISAEEQIAFLRRFYHGRLEVTQASMDTVKEILIQEQTPEYILSGKSGAGSLAGSSGRMLGWYVGYVEKEGKVFFFALNMEGENFAQIRTPRSEIVKRVLQKLTILPAA